MNVCSVLFSAKRSVGFFCWKKIFIERRRTNEILSLTVYMDPDAAIEGRTEKSLVNELIMVFNRKN